MDYQAPLAISLNIARGYGRTAWGLASSEDHFLGAETRPTATDGEAFYAGFEALLSHDEFRERGIDLYCPNEDLCTMLASMPGAFPHLSVVPHTDKTADGFLVRSARRAALTAITEPVPSTDVDTLDRIIAATDGSSGFRRGTPISGWGWVANTGLYDVGTYETNDILAAELYAICRVVKATPAHHALTVQVDSKAALSVVGGLRRGTSVLTYPVAREFRMSEMLRRLVTRLDGRDVTFEWVPSHSGIALNEGADRLAVMARRNAQAGMPKDARRPLADRIVAETLASHRVGVPVAA